MTLPVTSPDAVMRRQVARRVILPRGLKGRSMLKTYIQGVSNARRPLVVTNSYKALARAQQLGCPAIDAEPFELLKDSVDDIAAIARHFDGIYVCLGRLDLFDNAAYLFARQLAWQCQGATQVFYTYLPADFLRDGLRQALNSAIRVLVPIDHHFTAITHFCRTFMPKVNSAPLFEDAAALIVDWRKCDQKSFIEECVIEQGLNPRLLRKLVRSEERARQHAKDEQAMKRVMCS